MSSNIASFLLGKDIRPSVQRLAIYRYLIENKNHPTVDTVYSSLVESIPTLSRTTVYNTLNLFLEHNLVQVLPIEDGELRYDADVSAHPHFKCTSCENVYDFESFEFHNELSIPEGFTVEKTQVFLWGKCCNCQ